jgi:hypothetical protein
MPAEKSVSLVSLVSRVSVLAYICYNDYRHDILLDAPRPHRLHAARDRPEESESFENAGLSHTPAPPGGGPRWPSWPSLGESRALAGGHKNSPGAPIAVKITRFRQLPPPGLPAVSAWLSSRPAGPFWSTSARGRFSGSPAGALPPLQARTPQLPVTKRRHATALDTQYASRLNRGSIEPSTGLSRFAH